MRVGRLVCVALVFVPGAVLADDPHDPAMRDAAARARDHAMVRRLNENELAMVRERDARYAEGWRAVRRNGDFAATDAEYTARSRDYSRARDDYARQRAEYEREMARWRGAVAACRAGDYSACDN